MNVNDLTFNQLSAVLNAVYKQATGVTALAPVNTNEFVSVGQTLLKAGYDPLNTAISQVLTKTIFSDRAYTGKFKSLFVSNQRFGNITRKLSPIDMEVTEDDQRMTLEDGKSIDMYTVNKPKVLQENFYGANQYQKHVTVYKDQLDTAFNSPEEFNAFLGMIMGNINNQIEQVHEINARNTLLNLVGGVIDNANTNQVVHLLTEYNNATGLKLTATSVLQPTNFPAFVKWAYSRIEQISRMLSERSSIYHMNITDKPLMRHTPAEKQRVYLSSKFTTQVNTMVLGDTYHDNYLKLAKHESVNYWQNINNPDSFSVKPIYLNTTDGSLKTATAEVSTDKMLGVMFDEDAAGITVVNKWAQATPMNAAGGYSNYFWHFTDRYWNSFTENAIVFLLD